LGKKDTVHHGHAAGRRETSSNAEQLSTQYHNLNRCRAASESAHDDRLWCDFIVAQNAVWQTGSAWLYLAQFSLATNDSQLTDAPAAVQRV
jgi:hypothetical protein